MTRRLPLRGADLVLLGMHGLWRDPHLSQNTVFVVAVDGPLCPDRLSRAIERLLDVCPWPSARLIRPFPWGRLHWSAGPRASLRSPAVRHAEITSRAELQRLLEAELNAGIDPNQEPPVRFMVVEDRRNPSWGALVATWFHPLMDPRGGQNLLAYMAALDPDRCASEGGAMAQLVPSPDTRPLRERGRMARRSVAYMAGLAAAPVVSPGTRSAAPGRWRFRQQSYVDRDPPPRHRRDICWRLAVVGKAMAELWGRRGLGDTPFLVPISVDLRPKGEPGPIFGNMLAFHFARFRPSETRDVANLARALRGQMTEALRDGQIEANAVAMEFLGYRPVSRMLRELTWTAARETFSYNCADLMDVPAELADLFGRQPVNAYHVPAVPPRPGVGVFFNRCGTTQNLVVAWNECAIDEDEAVRIHAVVQDGMGWEAGP